jgi:hypothetical protein
VERVIEMYTGLVLALLLAPLALVYVFEQMAKAGKGPLAEPDRMIVLDGTITPAPAPVAALVDLGPAAAAHPLDAERCAAESRLVAALIAGELDRVGYQERMAELAAQDAAVRPVRLPPEPA